MSRFLYLVCYDVADRKKLRRIRKMTAAYAVGGQKSFYECWMTESELRQLIRQIENEIDLETDRAHLFSLDPRSSPFLFGVASRQSINPFMVI